MAEHEGGEVDEETIHRYEQYCKEKCSENDIDNGGQAGSPPSDATVCVDDPNGIVASSTEIRDCATVGADPTKFWWQCDYFDKDFDGHAVFVWQLCPKTCNRCDTESTNDAMQGSPDQDTGSNDNDNGESDHASSDKPELNDDNHENNEDAKPDQDTGSDEQTTATCADKCFREQMKEHEGGEVDEETVHRYEEYCKEKCSESGIDNGGQTDSLDTCEMCRRTCHATFGETAEYDVICKRECHSSCGGCTCQNADGTEYLSWLDASGNCPCEPIKPEPCFEDYIHFHEAGVDKCEPWDNDVAWRERAAAECDLKGKKLVALEGEHCDNDQGCCYSLYYKCCDDEGPSDECTPEETWEDGCNKCYCVKDASGLWRKLCEEIHCDECPIGYHVDLATAGQCCPSCKPDDECEPEDGGWQEEEPCTHCECVQDAAGVWRKMCAMMACDEPKCSEGTILVHEAGQCCPSCKPVDECEPQEAWEDGCYHCKCEWDQADGLWHKVCAEIACAVLDCPAGSHPVMADGDCCPHCKEDEHGEDVRLCVGGLFECLPECDADDEDCFEDCQNELRHCLADETDEGQHCKQRENGLRRRCNQLRKKCSNSCKQVCLGRKCLKRCRRTCTKKYKRCARKAKTVYRRCFNTVIEEILENPHPTTVNIKSRTTFFEADLDGLGDVEEDAAIASGDKEAATVIISAVASFMGCAIAIVGTVLGVLLYRRRKAAKLADTRNVIEVQVAKTLV